MRTVQSQSRAVCLVVQSVYDSDARVRRKAEALVSAGYSVDVLALRPQNRPRTYTLNGVHVETVRLGKERGSLTRYGFEYATFLFWVFLRVHVLTWKRRYAVIDVNTLPDFLIFAPLFARRLGSKLLLDMHEITPEFYMSKYGRGPDGLVVRVLRTIERWSFGFADHVLTINEPIRDLLVSRGLNPTSTTIIMNSADDARFNRNAPSIDAANHRSGKFVMMYHGTLTRIYGLDLAIDALAIASTDAPDAELWILGDGPEIGALADQAARLGLGSRVRVVGRVPPEEIPTWLEQCDAGVLPIRSDVFLEFAFPNKLPEFIIAGKPVIVSRLRAIRHYFGDEALAYAAPNDTADLARQMIRLYGDKELRSRLVASARREYSPIRWGVMKQRYVDLVDALAFGGQSHRSDTRAGAKAV